MKILIFGGRDFFDENIAANVLNQAFKILGLDFNKSTVEFIHGDAIGADTAFANVTEHGGFKVKAVPADWDNLVETPDNPVRIKVNRRGKKYNVLAGMNRNTKMVNECDVAIGVWDGVSPGTNDSISKLRRANKHVLVFDYLGNLKDSFISPKSYLV